MTSRTLRRRIPSFLVQIALGVSALVGIELGFGMGAAPAAAAESGAALESGVDRPPSSAPRRKPASETDSSATAAQPSEAEGGAASAGEGSEASEASTGVSPATEEMLKTLREKGILTQEEYEKIYRREAEFQAEKKAESALPGWLQNWTFGGDFRLRWDQIDYGDEFRPGNIYIVGQDNVNPEDNTGTGIRDRFMMRMRLGAEKKLNDEFTMGFRFATAPTVEVGGNVLFDNGRFPRKLTGDPRRADVSLGGYFEQKPVGIDRAYLRYGPTWAPGLNVTAGKVPNPFLGGNHLAEMITWDIDINPEGLSATYDFELIPERLRLDTAAAAFILDEVPGVTLEVPEIPEEGSPTISPYYDERDPYMWGLQAGLTGTPVPKLTANVRASYYELRQLNTEFVAIINDSGNGGDPVDENPLYVLSNAPTSAESEGKLRQVVVDGYFEYVPFDKKWLTMRPFWLYSQILTADDDNDAWVAGFALGDLDTVRFSALYGDIRRNGTISMFTDSVIFDGLTNIQGWYLLTERRLTPFMRVRGSFSKTRASEQTCLVTLTEPQSCDTAFAASPALLEQYRTTQRDRTRWQIDFLVEF